MPIDPANPQPVPASQGGTEDSASHIEEPIAPGSAAQSAAGGIGTLKAESAAADLPRNPVLRTLVRLGRLISSACAPATPARRCVFTSEGRAAAGKLRTELERVRRDLTSTRAGPRELATSLGRLANAQRQWDAIHPELQGGSGDTSAGSNFDDIVTQLLGASWSADTTHALAQALAGQRALEATRILKDPDAKQILQRLRDIIVPKAKERVHSSVAPRLQKVLSDLARRGPVPLPGKPHMRKLLEALRPWWELDPEAGRRFKGMVQDTLDRRWPDSQLDALIAQTMKGKHAVKDENGSGSSSKTACEGTPEWVLAQVKEGIRGVAQNRAYATIDQFLLRVIAAIRSKQLDVSIEQQAGEAMMAAMRIIARLCNQGTLDLPLSEGEDSSDALRVKTCQIIDKRLSRIEATDDEIAVLVKHLTVKSLDQVIKGPPESRIAKAAVEEIATRSERLIREIDDQIKEPNELTDPSGGFFRSDGSLLRDRFEQVDRKLARISEVASVLRRSASKNLERVLERFAPLVGRASASLDTLLADRRSAAKNSIRTVGDILENTNTIGAKDVGRLISDLLPACKAMTRAVERFMAAPQPTRAGQGHAGPGHDFEAVFDLLLSEMISELPSDPGRRRAIAIHAALNGGVLRALVDTLNKAAAKALAADLPELYRDLRHAYQALERIRMVAQKRAAGQIGTGTRRRGSLITDAQALAAIRRHYCVAIEPDGRVHLTAGRCSEPFTEALKQRAEEAFTATEKSMQTLPGGAQVPKQFVLDAERDGTEFLDQDGVPLIDRNGWRTLSPEEREQRIEAGYLRLRHYYGGNAHQTNAILVAANQTLVAAFEEASYKVTTTDGNPLLLDGSTPGRVNGQSVNGTHQSVMQFKIGPDHRPLLQLRYEVRGGVFWHHDASRPPVYLDLERSWARVVMEAQLNAAGDALELLGTPTYDVNLTRNWAQCDYPLPDRQFLLRRDLDPTPYQHLVGYTKRYQPQALPTLLAMQELSRIKPHDPVHAIGLALGRFYERRLSPQASELLLQLHPDSSRPSSAALELITYMTTLETAAATLFDEVETVARERLAQLERQHGAPPEAPGSGEPELAGSPSAGEFEPLSEKESREARRLAQFLEDIGAWRREPGNRLTKGLSIVESYFHDSPAGAPLFDKPTIRRFLEQNERLLRLIRESSPLIDALLAELAQQLPEGLLESFIAYLPGRLNEENPEGEEKRPVKRPAVS